MEKAFRSAVTNWPLVAGGIAAGIAATAHFVMEGNGIFAGLGQWQQIACDMCNAQQWGYAIMAGIGGALWAIQKSVKENAFVKAVTSGTMALGFAVIAGMALFQSGYQAQMSPAEFKDVLGMDLTGLQVLMGPLEGFGNLAGYNPDAGCSMAAKVPCSEVSGLGGVPYAVINGILAGTLAAGSAGAAIINAASGSTTSKQMTQPAKQMTQPA